MTQQNDSTSGVENTQPRVAQRLASARASLAANTPLAHGDIGPLKLDQEGVPRPHYPQREIPSCRPTNSEGFPTHVHAANYVYHAPCGTPVMVKRRYNPAPDYRSQPKTFRTLTLKSVEAPGGHATLVSLKDLPNDLPTPLYNLHLLAARPQDPVLLVEGEKAAEAAALLLPDFVTTCWSNGAAVAQANPTQEHGPDVRDLEGRTVYLWPDADAPQGLDDLGQPNTKGTGQLAMEGLAQRILWQAPGAKVLLVQPSVDWPDGYDLADPAPQGMDVRACLSAAAPVQRAPLPVAAEPAPKGAGRPKGTYKPCLERAASALNWLMVNNKLDLAGGGRDFSALLAAFRRDHGEDSFADLVRILEDNGVSSKGKEDNWRGRWASFSAEHPRPVTMASFYRRALDGGWQPPESSAGGGGKGKDLANAALLLAEEAEDEFWTDQNGEPHATFVGLDGVTRHAQLNSQLYSDALFNRLPTGGNNKLIGRDDKNRVLDHLGRQSRMAPRARTYLRTSYCPVEGESVVWVDLGQFPPRYVRVTAQGWGLRTECPVKFLPGRGGELPLPAKPSNPASARALFVKHFGLSGAGDRLSPELLKVVGFTLSVLWPGSKFYTLLLTGSASAGKSTFAEQVASIVDPAPAGGNSVLTKKPRTTQDLVVFAKGVRLPVVDNVSALSGEYSDAWCNLNFGGGDSHRKLFTDDSVHTSEVVRPAILAAINVPTDRADFISRCIHVELPPRPDNAGMADADQVLAGMRADHPVMLGFLLDCMAQYLANRVSAEQFLRQQPFKLSRAMGVQTLVESCRELLGAGPAEFSRLLSESESGDLREAASQQPFVQGVWRYLSNVYNGGVLEGTASMCWDAADRCLPERLKFASRDASNVNQLRSIVAREAAGMRLMGIQVDVTKRAGRPARYKFVAVPGEFSPHEGDPLPDEPAMTGGTEDPGHVAIPEGPTLTKH